MLQLRLPLTNGWHLLIASLALGFGHGPAAAAGYQITCAKADVMVPALMKPLTMSYDGGDKGTLSLSGALGDFKLPAKMEKQKSQLGDGASINGSGAASSMMPDLPKLKSCIATKAGGATDRDTRLFARDQCMADRTITIAPAKGTVWVRIGMFPGEKPGVTDAIVEITRAYEQDGTIKIESFPAQCEAKAS
ncbi:MAG: hypothetical protein AB7E80_00840 [Hyphomicrobiaceae bacterium]